VKDEPDNPYVYLVISKLNLLQGNPAGAVAACRSAIKKAWTDFKASIHATEGLARAYIANNQWHKARLWAKRIFRDDRHSSIALILIAIDLHENREWDALLLAREFVNHPAPTFEMFAAHIRSLAYAWKKGMFSPGTEQDRVLEEASTSYRRSLININVRNIYVEFLMAAEQWQSALTIAEETVRTSNDKHAAELLAMLRAHLSSPHALPTSS